MMQFCCLSSEALKKSREVLHLASSLWGNLWKSLGIKYQASQLGQREKNPHNFVCIW